MDELWISGDGLSRCPGCTRHVRLNDEVARTMCPFCGTPVLAAWRSGNAIDSVVQAGGRVGAVAAALRRISGEPPAAGVPRDPGMDGDPERLVRHLGEEDVTRPHPVHVVWELTLQCDLGCRHCGSRAGRARAEELTTEECFAVVDQLAELGVREITLIGGEAYLREDWTEVARRIVARGMQCTMTTGARQLSADRVRAAEAAGVAAISISIDGLERTHDLQRGVRGSWRAAVAAAERVAGSAIRLGVNSQLNALSAPELPAVARLLRDLGAAVWQIQLSVAMGRAADRPALLLQPYELLDLFPLLVWTREYVLDPAGIVLVPGNNVGYFGPFERLLRYGGSRGAHWTACAAGRWVLGIEADGCLKGCPSLPTAAYAAGNVRDTPLRTLVEGARIGELGRRTVRDLWGFCRGCYYAEVCRGGCTWTSHSLLGRPGNNPYCIHRCMTLEAQGRVERVVAVERAAGVPFDTGRFELLQAPVAASCASVDALFGVPIASVVAGQPSMPGLRDVSALASYLEVTTARLPPTAGGARLPILEQSGT